MSDEAKTQKAIDWLLQVAAELIAEEPAGQHMLSSLESTGEKAVVSYIKCLMLSGAGELFGSLPYRTGDKVVFEMQMRHGRADIVIFHIDGSVSVIEVKDGDRDVMSVVAGIGQVGFYAGQLAVSRAFPSIRRALMWTACSNDSHTSLVIDACKVAGVEPLLLPSNAKIKDMMSGVVAKQALEALKTAGEWVKQHGPTIS